MPQIAASIEYEPLPRPAGLPDDMHPLPGASLRFLSIKAIDGFKVQAALWQPENKPPAETTMIVEVTAAAAISPRSHYGRSLAACQPKGTRP
jgi:hypothetical protein